MAGRMVFMWVSVGVLEAFCVETWCLYSCASVRDRDVASAYGVDMKSFGELVTCFITYLSSVGNPSMKS